MYRQLMTVLIILSLYSSAWSAQSTWPGAPPDCWSDGRIVHGGDIGDIWKKNTTFNNIAAPKPANGTYSPNKGYFFVAEDVRPSGSVTIFAEKDYLIRIEFSELLGLSEVKWINEKLLFMRPWWGRIVATDLIYDVEAEKILYAESATDADLAYQQYRGSCPLLGCECIKKKSE